MTGIVTNNKYLPREKDKHDNDQNDDEVIRIYKHDKYINKHVNGKLIS